MKCLTNRLGHVAKFTDERAIELVREGKWWYVPKNKWREYQKRKASDGDKADKPQSA